MPFWWITVEPQRPKQNCIFHLIHSHRSFFLLLLLLSLFWDSLIVWGEVEVHFRCFFFFFFGWFSVFGFFFLAYTLTYSVNHLSWSFMFFLPLLKLGGPGHNLFESCFLKSRTWQTTAFGCVSCKEVLMPNVFALEQAFTEVKSPSKRLHCLLNF